MPNFLVQTVGATHYTGALLQNEAEAEAIPGLRADGTIEVKSMSIRSKQNLAWQVEQLDADGNILASHQFATSDAVPKLNTTDSITYYHYSFTPNEEWPVPHTKSYQATFAIRNTSADSKTAGTDGELVLLLKTCVEC